MAEVIGTSFPPGPSFDFRMDRHYLAFALSGSMRLETGGKVWFLTPSRAAFIPAGTPARVRIIKQIEAASVLFDPNCMAARSDLSVFDMPTVGRALLSEIREQAARAAVDTDYCRCLLTALAAVTLRAADDPGPLSLGLASTKVLRRAVDLTERRATEPDLTLTEIARQAGMSPRSLSRHFRDEMGMSWGEYLRRFRIITAASALADGEQSITEVALSVGYSSPSAFSVAFSELMQTAPLAYRKACRNA